jgi:hypothetical protein
MYKGKTYGTNLAAWWGYQYNDLIEEPKPREVITIYELDASGNQDFARPVYNFRWLPMTDPSGIHHKIYDYPGMITDHAAVKDDVGYYLELTGVVDEKAKTISVRSVKRLGDVIQMCARPPKK